MSVDTLTSFIGGSWIPPGKRAMVRLNPGRTTREASRWSPASRADARHAMAAAARAWPRWSAVSAAHRCDLLNAFLTEIENRSGALAAIITRENGKPVNDSPAEIQAALGDARHLLQEARVATRWPATPRSNIGVAHEPVGVYLLITPWNFPLATIVRKIVPALAFGNTVVLKPSELTPTPAVELVRAMSGLSLPFGTVNLVLGTGRAVGPALVDHPTLRGLSFTGSNRAGLELAYQTAGRDVRLQLEMGGKNSLLVMADADVDLAVEAALTGGFSCAGQWCTGTGRVIVETSVYRTFIDRLVMRANRLKIGPGDIGRTDMGPLITADRVRFARHCVRDAVADGATLACGGHRPKLRKEWTGHYFAPTVLTDVTEAMDVFKDELFVPVLPVIRADDYPDALRLANAGPFGLSASIFTSSRATADHFMRHVEAGLTHINLHTAHRRPELPVSAWRESGRGIPECGDCSTAFFARPRAIYIRP